MHIYTIGDLHLSLSTDKPMNIFGDRWENHPIKIEEAWRSMIQPEDIVVLPGDLSWAIDFQEVIPDLDFVNRLPGRKILLKGNHEHWWGTAKKLQELKEEHGFTTIDFMHNSYIYIEEKNLCLCGTRGWKCPSEDSGSFTEQDERVYKREAMRLETSLKGALEKNCSKIAFLHYPPCNANGAPSHFTRLMEEYEVEHCYYGHLHGYAHRGAILGKISPDSKTEYHLVSADYLDFTPLLIL